MLIFKQPIIQIIHQTTTLMNSKISAIVVLLFFSFTSTVFAQKKKAKNNTQDVVIDKAFYENLEWRNIGPVRGGRSLGSTGSPSRPNEYYLEQRAADYGKPLMVVTNGNLLQTGK